MRNFRFLPLSLHWSLVLLATFQVRALVLPSPTAFNEGNSFLDLPFSGPASRFQQVYSGSYIALVWPNGAWLDRISFRLDGRAEPPFFERTLSNLQISFSTTSFGPDGLSPVFAENIGADEQVCRSGSLFITGSDSGGNGPNSFEIEIPLTTPFFYDPRQGNLLMEIRNFGSSLTSSFDAQNVAGDTVSSVWALGADSLTGTVSTSGLVTDLHFLPVPEPSTWALCGLGLAGLIFRFNWRRKQP